MKTISIFSSKDIYELVSMREVVDVVEEAFRDITLGQCKMPAKVYLDLPEFSGDFRAMPAYSRAKNLATIKWVNSHVNNVQMGLPVVDAVLIANDPKTAKILAIMDAKSITALRTGASGTVAMKALAHRTDTWLFVGAGIQARTQCEAMCAVIQPKKIIVSDLNQEAINVFEREVGKWTDVEVVQKDLSEDVVSGSDIIVTTTPGRGVLFPADWVSEGTHINAIGADAEGKQELDSGILKRARVIVDDWIQASHSGEINVGIHKGIFKKEDHVGNLGDVLEGNSQGRVSESDITLFDSTGLAIQDLYVASEVLRKDKEKDSCVKSIEL